MRVVIVGGGTAGIAVAARLRHARDSLDIVLLDPKERHFYQPLWTLVGGGLAELSETEKPEETMIPPGVTWKQEAVAEFRPDVNAVITTGGERVDYDHLIVAAGIALAYDEVKGLKAALENDPRVWTNYDERYVTKGPHAIKQFRGGRALFTAPKSPMKCGGAPQKIMWVAEESFRRNGVRHQTNITYHVPGAAIFGIPKYRTCLEQMARDKDVELRPQQHLVEIDHKNSRAYFELLETGEIVEEKYDLLHVTPPQRAPVFLRRSPLAQAYDPDEVEPTKQMAARNLGRGPTRGFVDVDQHTLQHVRYRNVWSCGDAAGSPNAKTGAAARKQVPVVVANLLAAADGLGLPQKYNGYTSCPVVTGHRSVMLAEFGYDGEIMETFPFDQAQPRWTMWVLKRHLMPPIYWQGMMKGRM